MNSGLFKFLFFLTLYLPFQFALNPTENIDLASIRLAVILLFFLWLAESLRKKTVTIKKSLLTSAIGVFLFFSIFSAFFARNMDWSARKILFLLSIFPVYFVVSNIIDSREKLMKISRGLIYSGAAVAAIGLGQFLAQFIWGLENIERFWSAHVAGFFLGANLSQSVSEFPSWFVNISGETYFRAISFFPDPHMFSFYLGLLIPISLGLFATDRKKIWLIYFFILLAADILTFSRGAYLGLAAGSLFFIYISWTKIKRPYGTALFWLIFLMAGFLIVPSPISSRFASIFDRQDSSNTGRIAMWQEAAKIIFARPLTGAGIGNFSLSVDPLAGYREPYYAHNTYLDISSETGLFAGLAWVMILISAFRSFLRKSKKEPLFLGMAVSLVIFAAHSLVDTAIYSPVVLTLFLIIIALSDVKETGNS